MTTRPAGAGASGLEIDRVNRRVRLDGEPVRLGGRAFDLLAVLAAHPGRVFSARELLAAVWPDRVVEENNLRVQVTQLRRRLGTARILNVARRGYALSTAAADDSSAPSTPGPARPGARHPARDSAREAGQLRTGDFRAIYRLLGECGELWADPAAWQKHLLEGVGRMIRLPVGLHAELSHFHPGSSPQLVSAIDHGWQDDAHAELFSQGSRQPDGPFNSSPLDRRFRQLFAQHGDVTLTNAQVIADRDWTRSDFYHRYHRAAGMDHMIHSAIGTGEKQRVHLLAFGGREHRPTLRDREMVRVVHHELMPLIGTRLATTRHRSKLGLDTNRRQVLDCALGGADDRRIARLTGLSLAAVRLHIDEACAHFGVGTLRQLTAYLLQGRPRLRASPGDEASTGDGPPRP